MRKIEPYQRIQRAKCAADALMVRLNQDQLDALQDGSQRMVIRCRGRKEFDD